MNDSRHVVVTDVQMKFTSMVAFMVKWVLASIPALLILFLVGYFLMAAAVAIGEGLAPRPGYYPPR